jgi:ABC-type sugar transport system permease subunit
MYQTGIRFFRLGEASAMAFLFLAVLIIPIGLLFWQLRRQEKAA